MSQPDWGNFHFLSIIVNGYCPPLAFPFTLLYNTYICCLVDTSFLRNLWSLSSSQISLGPGYCWRWEKRKSEKERGGDQAKFLLYWSLTLWPWHLSLLTALLNLIAKICVWVFSFWVKLIVNLTLKTLKNIVKFQIIVK